MQVAVGNGVGYYLNHEVSSVEKNDDGYSVTADDKSRSPKVL